MKTEWFPENESGGLIGPGLVEHEFILQPSSSIFLCQFCGISKLAARTNTICDVGTKEQQK